MSSILNKEDILKAFSAGLAAYALRERRSQADLAATAGVVQSNVSHWLAARSTPSFSAVANLLAAGMSLREAFGDELAAQILERERGTLQAGKAPEDPAAVVRSGLQALLDGLR